MTLPTYTKGRVEAIELDAKTAFEQYQLAKAALTTDWPNISALPASAQTALTVLKNNQLRMLAVLRFLGKQYFDIEG